MMQDMPPEGAPDQAAPAEGQDAAPGGGPASQLIQGIQSDMKKLGALLEKAGVGSPEELKEYSGIISQFEDFIQNLSNGGAPDAAPGAVSSPEAGANPNARPM